MNPTRPSDQIYDTAFHEAAHAVMCITKRAPLLAVNVYEEADEEGTLGCCYHAGTDDCRDRAWIALAGPAADSLHKDIPIHEAFFQGGRSDFSKAYAAFGRVLYPKVPDELQDHIGTDVRTYITLLHDGWRPEGIRRQLKRKLTLFTERCLQADKIVCDWVHEEAAQVRDFIGTTPGIYECIEYLAGHLVERRKMSGREIIDLMWPYLRERQEAGKLAA